MLEMFNGYLATMKADQAKVFGTSIDNLDPTELEDHFRTMALALHLEVSELIEEFRWKPWKYNRGELVDSPERVAKEAVDVLHFLAHVLEVAGVDDDMLNWAMETERTKNRRRQEEGYAYS